MKTHPETNSGADKSCDNFIDGLFDNKDEDEDALLEDSSNTENPMENSIANDSLDNSAIGKNIETCPKKIGLVVNASAGSIITLIILLLEPHKLKHQNC